MNRRIAAWMTAAVAVFGLTACSGTPSATTAPPAPATTAPATSAPAEPATPAPSTPAEEPNADQSVAQACVSLAGPMAEASAAMAELASVSTTDAQTAVDTWTALVDAFGKFSESVTNPEVKTLATQVHQDITALRDAMQKVFVDNDMGAMSDYTTAVTDWQASYTKLMELCAG